MNNAEFASHLLAGERVQWSGQPKQGLLLVPQDAFIIPFSFLWGAMAFIGPGPAVLSEPLSPFTIIGLIFPVVAIYITVGRFFHDAWLRSRTRYALTDRRALILRGDRFISVDVERLEAVELKGGEERGTIRFGPSEGFFHFARRRWGSWLPSLSETPQFLAIEHARTVFRQVEQIRARRGEPSRYARA